MLGFPVLQLGGQQAEHVFAAAKQLLAGSIVDTGLRFGQLSTAYYSAPGVPPYLGTVETLESMLLTGFTIGVALMGLEET